MVTNKVSALIVGRPGRMRTSFQALLRMVPQIEIIGQVDHATEALALVARQRPALVFLDSSQPIDEVLAALRQIKNEWPQTQCIVFVDTIQQQSMTKAAGAATALLTGFSAETLLTNIEEVLWRGHDALEVARNHVEPSDLMSNAN